jgi:hypothetical protein
MSQFGSAALADPDNYDYVTPPDDPEYFSHTWQQILQYYYGTITIDKNAQNPSQEPCVGCSPSGGTPPNSIQTTQVSNGVRLTWNEPGNGDWTQNVNAYVLYKRPSTTSDITKAIPFARVTASVPTGSDKYLVFIDDVGSNTSLPNVTYYYSIAGINYIGEGPNSVEVAGAMPSVSSYTLTGRNFVNSIGTVTSSGVMTVQNDNAYNGASISIHGNSINILPETNIFPGSNVTIISP